MCLVPPPPETRVCRVCKLCKPIEEFREVGGGARRRLCVNCRTREGVAWKTRQRNSIETFASLLFWRSRERSRKLARKGVGDGSGSLSRDWVIKQWESQGGKCFYSGVLMNTGSGPALVTIERLDTTLGYQEDNCVLACYAVNMMRRYTPPEEFTWWCNQVAKNSPFTQQEP